MPTVTIKMSPGDHARLQASARRRNTSQSAVLREAFDLLENSETSSRPSLAERAAHLIGSLEGPENLSALSKNMEGYGETLNR
jgi:hypothetical protein